LMSGRVCVRVQCNGKPILLKHTANYIRHNDYYEIDINMHKSVTACLPHPPACPLPLTFCPHLGWGRMLCPPPNPPLCPTHGLTMPCCVCVCVCVCVRALSRQVRVPCAQGHPDPAAQVQGANPRDATHRRPPNTTPPLLHGRAACGAVRVLTCVRVCVCVSTFSWWPSRAPSRWRAATRTSCPRSCWA
jgi:hypothetical protein